MQINKDFFSRKLDGLNANMLVGTVAHQVFQRVCYCVVVQRSI